MLLLTAALALLPISFAAPAPDPKCPERFNVPWNIARLATNPWPQGQNPNAINYVYKSINGSDGSGTAAYVISSGCDVTPGLEGRLGNLAIFGTANAPSDPSDQFGGTGLGGTAFATIIGDARLGLATNAMIICTKVLKDNRPVAAIEDVIRGINRANEQANTNRIPSVILVGFEYDLGDGFESAFDPAETKLLEQAANNATIPVIAPAYPNPSGKIITVGATTINDVLAEGLAFHEGITLLAPGVDVRVFAANENGSTIIASKKGTVFAAAHVAGLSLGIMSQEGRQLSPEKLKRRLLNNAVRLSIGPPDSLRNRTFPLANYPICAASAA